MTGNDKDPNLPENFDGPVPSAEDFAKAAMDALADEVTFILLHESDMPDEVIKRIPRMLERMRAVISLKGPHQARAIRMILKLRPRFLAAGYRLKQWGDLLTFALTLARDLKDEALYGEVIRAWGLYHAIYYNTGGADAALKWSASKLQEAADPHVAFMRRVDDFNVRIMSLAPEQVVSEAWQLLREARKMQGHYFPGRIFHSLARYFRSRDDSKNAFMCGQQALCYYWEDPEAWQELIAQVMLTMTDALRTMKLASDLHQRRILDQLDRIMQHKVVNPMVTAKVLHEHAIQHYRLENYEEAKQLILKAAIQYRLVADCDGWARARHIWGQAQRELGHWAMADRHLRAASRLYQKLNKHDLYVLAQVSYAMVPFEQQDWHRAYSRFLDARTQAEQLPAESASRTRRIAEIDNYLADVRTHLNRN